MTALRLPEQATPWSDPEAEQACLGACFLDAGAVHVLRMEVLAEDFSADRNRTIAAAMYGLADRGAPIDLLSLRDELDRRGGVSKAGGIDYLSDLVLACPTTANLQHYSAIVAGKAAKRRRLDALRRAIEEIERPDSTIDEVDAIYDAARSASAGRRTRTEPLRTILGEHLSRITAVTARDGVTGMRTGFRRLDRLTGGFLPQQLVFLGARPSLGKTSLALQISRTIAATEGAVLIFSLEMARYELANRLVAQEAGVDGHALRGGQLVVDEGIGTAFGRLADLPVWIDDTPRLRVSTMRARARWVQAQHPLAMIVVDHVQLARGEDRGQGRVAEMTQITADLKGLAKELECTVLALSQLTRDSEHDKRQPVLRDLRESGSLEQDADIVLFLHRDPERAVLPGVPVAQDLIVGKHRDGEARVELGLLFDGPRFTFQEA